MNNWMPQSRDSSPLLTRIAVAKGGKAGKAMGQNLRAAKRKMDWMNKLRRATTAFPRESTNQCFGRLLEGIPVRSTTPTSSWHGLPEYEPSKQKAKSLLGRDIPISKKRAREQENRCHRGISRIKTIRDIWLTNLGAWGVTSGAKAAKSLITGRTTLYHGSDTPGINAIRTEGLRSAARTGRRGVTDAVLSGDALKRSKQLVFTTKSRNVANAYRGQAEWLRAGAPGGARGRQLAPFHVGGGIAKYNVPLWRKGLKKHIKSNPEIEGGLKKFMKKGGNPVAYMELKHNTVAMKNKLPNQFQVGHKKYIPYSMKEFKQYAKQHPGRVAGGAALAGLTLAGAYGVGKYAKRAWKARKERKAQIAAQEKREITESTNQCFNRLLEGKFSKYGRGFLRKQVNEKGRRQELHAARKAMRAAPGDKGKFSEYIDAKRNLIDALKTKKYLQHAGVTSKRRAIKDERQTLDMFLIAHKSASKKSSNALHRNQKLVSKLGKRMGSSVTYKPSFEPERAIGGCEGGHVLSSPTHGLSAHTAAHEVGHSKSPNMRRLEKWAKELDSQHLQGKAPRGAIAKLTRDALDEEVTANKNVAKHFQLNRRNRVRAMRAMDTYTHNLANVGRVDAPMGKTLKALKKYQKDKRELSQMQRTPKTREAVKKGLGATLMGFGRRLKDKVGNMWGRKATESTNQCFNRLVEAIVTSKKWFEPSGRGGEVCR